MAFPESFIDELIARNPIEDVVGQYVSLKRSGGNLFVDSVENFRGNKRYINPGHASQRG